MTWFRLMLVVPLMLLASCKAAPEAPPVAEVDPCCQEALNLHAEIPACCQPNLAGASTDCCCAKGLAADTPDAERPDCCKKTLAILDRMRPCCRSTLTGGEAPECCQGLLEAAAKQVASR